MTKAEHIAEICRRYGQIVRDFECKMLGNFYRCTRYKFDKQIWVVYMRNGEVMKVQKIRSDGGITTIWN